MRIHPWREAPEAEFAVIGDPIKHSLSPRMQSAALQALGLTHRYVAVHVPVGESWEALDHLASVGYVGVNVTVPHKESALRWCRTADDMARRIGAANTLDLRTRSCLNTDAPGFLETLNSLGVEPCVALLLGAGGSARAIAIGLADEGFQVRVWNRTRTRAEELIGSLQVSAEVLDQPEVSGAGLIVNSTSASLEGATVPIEWRSADSNTVAYDLAYGEGPTPFMEEAAEHGIRALDGRRLLVAQGALSMEWWLGQTVPRDVMLEAIS